MFFEDVSPLILATSTSNAYGLTCNIKQKVVNDKNDDLQCGLCAILFISSILSRVTSRCTLACKPR